MKTSYTASICWRPLLILFGFMLLSGCTSSPPSGPPGYCLVFDADRQVNTGVYGQPLPIKIYTLLLRSDAEFIDADFFSLQNDNKNVLGNSLLDSEQFFLTPGQKGKKLQGQKIQDARYIGIIAEYQILNGKVWRLSLPLSEIPTIQAEQECQPSSGKQSASIFVGVNGLKTPNMNK